MHYSHSKPAVTTSWTSLLASVLLAICGNAYAAEYFSTPPENQPEYLGAPPGACDKPSLHGPSVLVVAQKWITLHNQITGQACFGQCRNPATLISVNEQNRSFVIRSVCTGGLFTFSVNAVVSPKQDTCTTREGNPCIPATGQKVQTETDYSGSGLRFSRTYNSASLDRVLEDRLGKRWRHSYDRKVSLIGGSGNIQSGNTTASLWLENGRVLDFVLDTASGQWLPDPDVAGTLTELKNEVGTRTGWEYRATRNLIDLFDEKGRLISMSDQNGLVTTLEYNLTIQQGADGDPETLDRVTDPFGRTLTFSYDANRRLRQMNDPAGNIYTYSYDTNANLVSVSYPDDTPGNAADNPQRIYHYENTAYPNHLTGITDENQNRFATWTYDAEGRVTSSEHAGGAERIDLTYNQDGTTTVASAQGGVRTYQFVSEFGSEKPTAISGDPCPNCGEQYAATTYDSNGFVASRTDFNGNITTFINDASGQVLSRTEAAGTPLEKTTLFEWHPQFRLPTRVTEPGKITDFVYDGTGRLVSVEETEQ